MSLALGQFYRQQSNMSQSETSTLKQYYTLGSYPMGFLHLEYLELTPEEAASKSKGGYIVYPGQLTRTQVRTKLRVSTRA